VVPVVADTLPLPGATNAGAQTPATHIGSATLQNPLGKHTAGVE
jgi:hypothetical protein